jgi:hypothetical protein
MRTAKVRSRRDPADLGFWVERVTVERVTGIEPALSAWGIMSRPLESSLHAVDGCPLVTVDACSMPP